MFLLRLAYKPIAIIAGLIAGRISKSLFTSVWSRFDDAPPPKPGTGEASMGKVVGAQALQAGMFAAVAAAVDRLFAAGFHEVVGIWPKKPPEPDADEDDRRS
ncbi:MAG: DUF4235 domain-containing protein [Solirubrobacteraceae bacterium]